MTRSILDIRLMNTPPHELPLIAPGVRGAMIPGPELKIPLVWSEEEGIGAMAHFLDHLPTGKPVRFETVINPTLQRMLKRRGFEWEDDDMVRKAQ